MALREKPDLLVLDIMMPDLDGLELLRRVRRHQAMEKVPTIIVSARVSSVDQQRMVQLMQGDPDEVDAYIGKPFDPASLLKTVKRVLVKHKDFLLEKNKQPEKPWERDRVY